MLKSKTLQMLALFAVAGVVWALLNFWYVPSLGKFSCSYVPYFVAEAQADTGDSCPESVKGAMTDSRWAADRYEEIEDEHDTTGVFFDDGGERRTISSGDEKGADAQRARRVLAEVGASSIRGQYPAATHVEVKVAALMRESHINEVVLVINHVGGPCSADQGLSCQEVLPMVLPSGAHLRVWFPRPDDSSMGYVDFSGG